jgi:UDP-glucuronate 4-epimerase
MKLHPRNRKSLDLKVQLDLMPMQDVDVLKSHDDVTSLIKDFDYTLRWNIQDGIKCFTPWYVDYYKPAFPV